MPGASRQFGATSGDYRGIEAQADLRRAEGVSAASPAGHSSPATTAIYAALDLERLHSIVDSIEVPVA